MTGGDGVHCNLISKKLSQLSRKLVVLAQVQTDQGQRRAPLLLVLGGMVIVAPGIPTVSKL